MTEQEVALLRSSFNVWVALCQLRGEPFADPKGFDLVAREAVKFGAPDVMSAWARALFELHKQGLLKPRKPAPIPQSIPADFQNQLDAMSSTELRERLSKDRIFSDYFGRFSAGERPEGFVVDEDYQLTAEQWHSLPPTVASVKMRDPKFRKAVDKLIFARQI